MLCVSRTCHCIAALGDTPTPPKPQQQPRLFASCDLRSNTSVFPTLFFFFPWRAKSVCELTSEWGSTWCPWKLGWQTRESWGCSQVSRPGPICPIARRLRAPAIRKKQKQKDTSAVRPNVSSKLIFAPVYSSTELLRPWWGGGAYSFVARVSH